AHRLHGLAADEQHSLLVDLVRSHVATVLCRSGVNDIDPGQAFQDLGFDSLTAVELRNRLKTATGLTLSPTLIFDYPTPTAVAQHIAENLGGVYTTTSSSRIEGELRKLENLLETIEASEKSQVADRLRVLLSRITDQHGTSEQIQAATTPDELFRLID